MRHKPTHNNHHTQFSRASHEAMPNTARLREDRRLIVPLDIETHNELHRNVAAVPTIPHYMAGRALSLFRDFGDAGHPLGNLENYMRSIEEAKKHPRTSELERRMADLTIYACELQIPFIKEGYVEVGVKYHARHHT